MKIKELRTDKEIRIAFDPYRTKIVEQFFIHKGEAMTAKQIADHMEEPPSKINYHIKKLESIDILRKDHTENINGIIAQYYIMPHDTISMMNKEISSPLKKQARLSIQESNFHIGLERFLQLIPQGKAICEAQNDDLFYFGTNYYSIFIKDEQFNDLAQQVFNVLKPYTEAREDRNEYKVLMSSIKIKESTKQK